MKADTIVLLENSFNAITLKSNEQTNFQQQRKAFTSVNKGLYAELYAYISDVAKLGKIIFQGEQKASEYTIDNLIALVNSSQRKKNNDDNEPSQSYNKTVSQIVRRFYYMRKVANFAQQGKNTVFKIIDKMLTTKKFKDFFNKNVAAL